MPMVYMEPEHDGETKKYRFWIRSSRGTDESEVVEMPVEYTKEDLRYEVEAWCKKFAAWHVSQNCVSYGFEAVE